MNKEDSNFFVETYNNSFSPRFHVSPEYGTMVTPGCVLVNKDEFYFFYEHIIGDNFSPKSISLITTKNFKKFVSYEKVLDGEDENDLSKIMIGNSIKRFNKVYLFCNKYNDNLSTEKYHFNYYLFDLFKKQCVQSNNILANEMFAKKVEYVNNPFFFFHNYRYYAIVGSKTKNDNCPAIILCKASYNFRKIKFFKTIKIDVKNKLLFKPNIFFKKGYAHIIFSLQDEFNSNDTSVYHFSIKNTEFFSKKEKIIKLYDLVDIGINFYSSHIFKFKKDYVMVGGTLLSKNSDFKESINN